MADAQIRITADTSQAERALGSLNNTLKGLVTVAGISALAKFSDSITNLQNKLSLVTQEGQSASDAFNVVAKSALMLGAPLKDVGDLFFRVANNTKDLSLTQKEQIGITETLIKGFQLTGASMAEVQGGVIQLGQAFAQGVLRGDELNSVMEALPMVADALATKFGVQRGALKALGEQGKITSRDLKDAIQASGAEIDKAWGQRIPTITENFNRMQTALGAAFQQSSSGASISEALSLAILKITVALVQVIKFFEDWAGVIKVVLSLLGAMAAFTVVGRVIGWFFGALKTGAFAVEALTVGFSTFLSRLSALPAFFAQTSGGLSGILRTVRFLLLPIEALIKGFLGLAAAVGGFLGISSLFPGGKKEAMNEQITLQEKLNKLLGLDQVEASDKARKASNAATAEQIKNAASIEKATTSRNEELRKIMQTQMDINTLTAYGGDEYEIQNTILKTNRDLVKEILDSNGKRIGFTRALSTEEENQLRTLLQQTEVLKQQQALRALRGPESTSAVTGRASSIFGQTQQGIAEESKRQMAGLELLKTNKLITEQEYADQSILIEQSRADAIMALDEKVAAGRMRLAGVTNQAITDAVIAQMANVKMIQQGGIAGAQGALGALTAITGTMANTSKSAFEMHKKLAIAQAMISTFQAATMAIAAPPGPPFSYLYVATAIAAGMAQIAQIRSQQYSGRALGGPVMGNTPYIVGERGPELFTPSSSGSITRNDQLGGGNVNVNFSIVANDTNGFDSLLNSRKGMIKQMISDAMLEKGQRF